MTYTDTYPTIGRPVEADPDDLSDLTVAEIEEIYREDFPLLTRRIRSYGQYGLSRAATEDAVQDAFVKALEKRKTYHNIGKSPKAWINTLVTHKAIDATRKNKNHNEKYVSEDSGYGNVLDKLSQEKFEGVDSEYDSTLENVRSALQEANKPDFWFQVLYLIAIYGYSYEDTADAVGVPIGTVKSSYLRVKKWLRENPELSGILAIE